MRKDPTVSVVVLNWNGKKFIDPFFESINKQTYPADKLEVLFVDNDSSDESLEYLEQNYGDQKNLKIVKNDNNYGYAGGNNKGMHQATGDYVLICNNDLILDKDLVKNLVSSAQKHVAGAVVPLLMFQNKPGIINNAGSRLEPKSSWPVYDIGINEKDEGQYSKDAEVTAVCGACVMFSRDFLQQVGLFDDKFFMYFEDADLSWRGQKRGFKFYLAPKARAYHYHTGSSKEGSPLFNHYVGRNRLLIVMKQASLMVVFKAWKATLYDHFLLRLKHIWLSLFGKYGKKQALIEFARSQKIIWAAVYYIPYTQLKRLGFIKEDRI